MFESFGFSERYLIYRALLDRIRTCWGHGFLNNDQGHLAYRFGCKNEWNYKTWGDSPEHNTLYKMMNELSKSLKDCGDFRQNDFIFSWADFCRIATSAYDEHKQHFNS